ncbi:MAG TPA: polymer-forming cytoskeletal protein [Caldisericia bacterium]|mgnify:CR=1 FL=1|nr:polymer-forming cytoskeletal protein [Caldisericia bacterium]HPF48697.1 polymer-forming cytoskeletal protein [Caldisericia bacterium]HPI83643.1 polymer-forming cytoskeletal protein [Caldisericia bacterium]HPQ93152.1 polymer-forming cytoskeletal protein [Caldisericia bacterium]HRV75015.1 polymer-forming cytoskeletal protein [Caldisericia bacterium]
MFKKIPTDVRDRSESYIASTVRIVGTIYCNGILRIDGALEGEVEGEGHLIVGRSGHIKGDVKMRSVTNLGLIEGNLHCTELIELLEGSKLLGDVSLDTSKFRIEDNVTFSGKSNTNLGK